MPGMTSVYSFEYPLDGEPVADWYLMAKANADKYEAALLAAANPPSPTDFAAMVAAGWFTDTGWVNLTLLNSHTVLSGSVAQYRRVGKRVMLRGALSGPSSGTIAVSTIGASVPSGLWPDTFQRHITATGATSGDIGRRLNVNNANGQITLNASGAGAIPWQSLDSVAWSIP
jgi:hypothetical protein